MSDLNSRITTGAVIKPPRILLYGVEGIGKSFFGASALSPIFVPTEEGAEELDVARFPKAKTFDELMDNLRLLYTESHHYKTVIIDSLDWLEALVWAHTCAVHAKSNIEDFGYGKGYKYAMDAWERFILGLDKLREDKGLAVVLIGHAEIKRFDSPELEPYDRYQIKLHNQISSKIVEWCDAVLFANYQIFTTKTDVGFNKKVVRGIGGDSRLMYTEERPAFKAKNRYGLPPELPFVKGQAWDTLMEAIRAGRPQPKEITTEDTKIKKGGK